MFFFPTLCAVSFDCSGFQNISGFCIVDSSLAQWLLFYLVKLSGWSEKGNRNEGSVDIKYKSHSATMWYSKVTDMD